MAQRLKTIEYAFPTDETARTTGTRVDAAAITLDIPEATSRTFRSVVVEVTGIDQAATAASITAWLIGIKLGAVAFDDVTVTDTITNTGEGQSFAFTRDVTSYFATNFGAGTSQTCQVGVTITGISRINTTIKLIITYEYDDNGQTTRVKTVKIPIESLTGVLTTTLAELGTNQVPLLDTFLPENTKSFKNIFFEIYANEEADLATDFALELSLDAEAGDADGTHEAALDGSRTFKYIWVRNAMTTSAVHAFKARSTVDHADFNHMAVVLVVTYTYNHTNSTSIINSLWLPWETKSATAGGTAAADDYRSQLKIMVVEQNVALVQSGLLMSFNDNSPDTVNVLVGGQTARAYTVKANSGTLTLGCQFLTHRFDSGGAQGSGLTLARGENIITIDVYGATTMNQLSGVGGVVILNYTSDKDTNGDGVHNHTISYNIMSTAANDYVREASAFAPNIPETNYWVTHWGCQGWSMVGVLAALVGLFANHEWTVERLAGEDSEEGWHYLGANTSANENELSLAAMFIDITHAWRRHPADPDPTKLAVEGSRKWRIAGIAGETWWNSMFCLTYHAITFTWTGDITNSAGGAVTIGLHDPTTGRKVSTGSRTGNGSYSITWYDDTTQLFAEAKEDSTHLGRSDTGTAA